MAPKIGITGDELSAVLALNLPHIGLDKYVRARRLDARVSYKEAIDIAQRVSLSVKAYQALRFTFSLTHRQIMRLYDEGYAIDTLAKHLKSGSSFRKAKAMLSRRPAYY